MRKYLLIALALVLAPAMANATAPKVFTPLQNSTMQAIGGADSTGSPQILRVNPDGSIPITILPPPMPTVASGIQSITDVGATDNVQLPDVEATTCSVQAFCDNAGSVYIGGADITNKSGTARGTELIPCAGDYNISVANLNTWYVAADVTGDKVTYNCN